MSTKERPVFVTMDDEIDDYDSESNVTTINGSISDRNLLLLLFLIMNN